MKSQYKTILAAVALSVFAIAAINRVPGAKRAVMGNSRILGIF